MKLRFTVQTGKHMKLSPLEHLGARLHQLASVAAMQAIDAMSPWTVKNRMVNNIVAFSRLDSRQSQRRSYQEFGPPVIFKKTYHTETPWPIDDYLYLTGDCLPRGDYTITVYPNLIEIHADSVIRDYIPIGLFSTLEVIHDVMNLKCTLHRPTLEPLDWYFEHYVGCSTSIRYIRVELEPRRALLAFAHRICQRAFDGGDEE